MCVSVHVAVCVAVCDAAWCSVLKSLDSLGLNSRWCARVAYHDTTCVLQYVLQCVLQCVLQYVLPCVLLSVCSHV